MHPKQKSSPRHSPKPKLLLDEGFPPRRSFKFLNSFFDIKHIKHDLRFEGLTDKDVYEIAKLQNRVLITFNVKEKDYVGKFLEITGETKV